MDRLIFNEHEPIILHICVNNNTNIIRKIKLYDTNYTSFQPVLYDIYGREIANIVPYRLKNRNINDVIKDLRPRIVELSSDERIIHSINLNNLYNMKSDTEYRVKVLFFPDIEEQNLIPSDNTLNFTIQQSDIFDKKSSIPKEERHISPSEIVLLMLHAEKSKKWDDYFKYLKIESFISAYPAYVRTYKIAEETKKLKIIEDFKKFLKKDRNDYILEYKILNQSLLDDNNYAYVDTLVKRYGIRIPYTYIYRYTLEKYKNFWVITDVQANVIKGQKS